MHTSRIPDFCEKTQDGMLSWFAEMSIRDLLFHPDDSPSEIFVIATNERTFSGKECRKLESILGEMFNRFGDGVYDAAYPIFMKRMGIRLDS